MSTMRFAKGRAVVVAGVLVVVGCGAEQPELAQQVTNQVNGQRVRVDGSDAASGCGSEKVTDEYGFEVEVATCNPSQKGNRSFESLVQDIPDLKVRSAAIKAHESVLRTNELCHDLDGWHQQLIVATQAVQDLTALVGVSTQLQAWTGSSAAEGLVVELRDVLIGQQYCVEGAATGDVSGSLLEAMGMAVSAYDDLALTVRNPASPQIAGDYWYHFDQVGHLREIDRLRNEGQPVEILFLGSSAAKRAFDANVVTEQLGMSTMNAGVPAMFMGLVDSWWETLASAGVQPDVVVVSYVPMLDYRPCSPARASRLETTGRLRSQAFASLPVFDEVPAEVVLTGDYSQSSSAYEIYDRLETVRGTPRADAFVDLQRIATSLSEFESHLAHDEPCEIRVAGFERLLEQVESFGVQIIIVALPVHPSVGAEGQRANRISIYEGIAVDRGFTHLDLSTLLARDEFSDLTHANALGRERVTSAVLVALRAE